MPITGYLGPPPYRTPPIEPLLSNPSYRGPPPYSGFPIRHSNDLDSNPSIKSGVTDLHLKNTHEPFGLTHCHRKETKVIIKLINTIFKLNYI